MFFGYQIKNTNYKDYNMQPMTNGKNINEFISYCYDKVINLLTGYQKTNLQQKYSNISQEDINNYMYFKKLQEESLNL